jgi:TRAP-type C4-dicarboxylate transport system permease small subunit
MKDLNWRSALRRAAIFTLIWLGIVYVTSVLWPESFGIEVPEELPFLAINAVFFFIIFALFSAFAERRRARHTQQSKSKDRPEKERSERSEEEGEGGPLKGRPNPNTSRRKTRRRR